MKNASSFDPELLQARWVLGGVEPGELVAQAVSALEHGFDNSAFRQLAGLNAPCRRDLGSLPERAFAELGLPKLSTDEAIKLVCERGVVFSSPLISEIVQSFPNFAERWNKHVVEWGGNAAGSYNDMRQFVKFVVKDLYEGGETNEVQRAFDFMERALVGGDEDARDLVSLGFFETLQCVASWRPYGNRAFEQFLSPNSQKVWEYLRAIWQGKSSLMDVIRAEKRQG